MNEIDLIAENKCLNFELKTLAGIMLRDELERWVYGYCHIYTEQQHLERYEFAKKFVVDKRVLDIACGSGYGTKMLKEGGAIQVDGVDIDKEVIDYASYRNKAQGVSYYAGNAQTYRSDKRYDVIISYETAEHIEDVGQYFTNMKLNLSANGIFIVSTPISDMDFNPKPYLRFHLREWGFEAFQKEVEKYFEIAEVLLQISGKNTSTFTKKVINKIKKQKFPKGIIRWNPKDSKAKSLGKLINGFQILVCKTKIE